MAPRPLTLQNAVLRMCTVGCKPSTLDLSKGEGSNLNKTGSFLLDEWRNLDDEIKLIYNKEAQLIKVKSH